MSVFQLHDWWSTQISSGQDEEFDLGCLSIGNVDNCSPPADKIVTGSQSGVLRIFAPSQPIFRVEDLVHEEVLDAPILQVGIGRFVPSSPNLLGLAVLHPRKIAVYELVPHGEQGGRAAYYELSKLYQHRLGIQGEHFTAFNMLFGPFGGVHGKDMIMVQSMDGKLQVFDQTAEAFTCQMTDCLLPGCLLYLRRMDAFITTNYSNRVECYRFQVLVNAQGSIGEGSSANNSGSGTKSSFGLTAVRNAMVEWSVNMGDDIIQIADGNFGSGDGSSKSGEKNENILVLCLRSLFLLKDNGAIMQQRRLEKDPACFAAYEAGLSGGHNFILAYRDHTIQVFTNFQLVWAVAATTIPVQIHVANFGKQKGLVVTVDDKGYLNIGYLGTKPPVSAIGGLKRDIDYDKIDEEHRKLLQVIRDMQGDHKSEPNEALSIKSQVPKVLDRVGSEDSLNFRPPEDVVRLFNGVGTAEHIVKLTVRLFVSYSGSNPATNVNISVTSPPFLHCLPSNIVLQQVAGARSTPTILQLNFFANKTHLPTSLDVKVMATYMTAAGEPRVCSHLVNLPLAMACRLRPAAKSAPLKLTLDTQFPPQKLNELFADFIHSESTAGSDLGDLLDASGGEMALGFMFWCKSSSSVVHDTDKSDHGGASGNGSSNSSGSIIVSKSGGRYRVQADSVPALYVLASELIKRLTIRLREISSGGKGGPPKFSLVSFSDQLPTDTYFSLISEHFSCRQQIQESLSQLNDCSHQFRMIEKRLLARFKDRTPSPLAGLDTLMRETYQSIMFLSSQVESHQRRRSALGYELTSASKLMALLSYLKFGMNPMEFELLESYLCPELSEGVEQGWEEIVDASLTYLLRTSLAKNVKDSVLISHQLEPLDDVEKLTKHIGMVFDRLGKGGKLMKLKAERTKK